MLLDLVAIEVVFIPHAQAGSYVIGTGCPIYIVVLKNI